MQAITVPQAPVELEAYHLFDACSRPDLAAYEENLIVIPKSIHQNFHKWIGAKPHASPRILSIISCATR
jgi:hypothetical protein